jgi:hypothetical protein
VEKLDLLVWDLAALEAAPGLLTLGVRALAVSQAARLENPPLLLGRGPALAGMVEVWVDSVDMWPALVECVPSDAYLVTESVPQRPSDSAGLLTHLTWFPKPERLTEEEFFHGWQVVHTPSSAALHPRRQGYVRDAVARTLTPGSPAVRAIVSEYFALKDYLDPSRLFGGKEVLARTMDELPLYADAADISSCPGWQTVHLPRS